MVKNIDDARYQENEQRFLDILAKYFTIAGDTVTFDTHRFCREHGIIERTFINHGGVDGLLRRISKNVASGISAIAKDSIEKCHDAYHLYFSVMRYMKDHRQYFEINQKRHCTVLWDVIFQELQPALDQIWRSGYGTDKDEIIYTLYREEVTAVFSFWVESGFSSNQFFAALKRIERLTLNAPTRLIRLV